MKRRGKRANKKAYSHYSKAVEIAGIRFRDCGIELGIYECPTCLDYHLTSQYCNTQHLHRKWINRLAKDLAIEENRFNNNFFPNDPKVSKRRLKGKHRQKKIDKVHVTKEGQLSQAEMKKVFATFDPVVYPQPKTKWARIRDIIVDTKAGLVHAFIKR